MYVTNGAIKEAFEWKLNRFRKICVGGSSSLNVQTFELKERTCFKIQKTAPMDSQLYELI